MRIAFASDENKGLESNIAFHFGRCKYYVFVDVEDKEIKKIEVKENPFFNQHQPGIIPQFIAKEKANVIIAGGMGPRAVDWFKKLGIRPITGVKGKVKDVLNDFLEGKSFNVKTCKE